MKREIVCLDCLERWKKTLGLIRLESGVLADPYPGEHLKYVRGETKGSYCCDQCGKPIPVCAQAAAVSIWSDHNPNVYYEWEDEFIDTGTVEEGSNG
jgi:hypothetical protein